MSEKVRSLGAARAEKAQDSRLWTPVECLEDLLARFNAGEFENCKKLAVHFITDDDPEDPDGQHSHHYQLAGLTYESHVALLHLGLARVVECWRGR
jgi:hypothetical protein